MQSARAAVEINAIAVNRGTMERVQRGRGSLYGTIRTED